MAERSLRSEDAPSRTTAHCPYCSEPIASDAERCPHGGRWFADQLSAMASHADASVREAAVIAWRGEVRFYCDDKTGDLGGFGRYPADPSNGRGIGRVYGEGGCQTTAGAAPSTKDEPAFWKEGVGLAGSAFRYLSGYWNCCCEPGFFNVYASPSQ